MKVLMRFLYEGGQRWPMATEDATDETTVTDRYAVTIPAPVRERLDVRPGDSVRWHVDEDGDLSVELVREESGAFDDFEPVSAGEMDVVEEHDTGFVDYPE